MHKTFLKTVAIAVGAFLLHAPAAHAWGYGHGMLQVNPGTGNVTGLPNSAGGATTVSATNQQPAMAQPTSVAYEANMPAPSTGAARSSQSLAAYYDRITKKNLQAAERESE